MLKWEKKWNISHRREKSGHVSKTRGKKEIKYIEWVEFLKTISNKIRSVKSHLCNKHRICSTLHYIVLYITPVMRHTLPNFMPIRMCAMNGSRSFDIWQWIVAGRYRKLYWKNEFVRHTNCAGSLKYTVHRNFSIVGLNVSEKLYFFFSQ